MDKTSLSKSQVLFIGSGYVFVATLVSIPSVVNSEAGHGFWMSYIIALVYGLASLYLFIKIWSRFPRKTVAEGMINAYPFFGRLFVALYVLFFFTVLVRDLRAAVDFVQISLLNVTPLWVINALLTVTIVLAVQSGRLIVARLSQIWQPLLLFLILTIPVVLMNEFNLKYLLPLFDTNAYAVWEGSTHLFPYMGEAIGIAFIANFRSWTPRFGLMSVVIGWTALLLLNLYTVLTLGIDITTRALYPNYEMVRHIRVTDFLDRFDLPLVGIWLPAMIVKITYNLYIIGYGARMIMPRLPFKRFVAGAGGVAAVVSLVAFKSVMQLLSFNRPMIYLGVLFEFIIPALILMFLLVFKRRKGTKTAIEA